ncbi:MAG: hypothetical protein ABIR30_15125 [Chitinophagaceae bacterium]
MINKLAARQSFSFFFAFSFLAIILLDRINVFEKNGIEYTVVLGGNLILFAATVLSFIVSMRSLRSTNPNASVRSLYGSFMIKFFVIAVAAFIYILVAKKNVNKPALMICMGLYLVYSFLEVSSLQKLLKQKKDA